MILKKEIQISKDFSAQINGKESKVWRSSNKYDTFLKWPLSLNFMKDTVVIKDHTYCRKYLSKSLLTYPNLDQWKNTRFDMRIFNCGDVSIWQLLMEEKDDAAYKQKERHRKSWAVLEYVLDLANEIQLQMHSLFDRLIITHNTNPTLYSRYLPHLLYLIKNFIPQIGLYLMLPLQLIHPEMMSITQLYDVTCDFFTHEETNMDKRTERCNAAYGTVSNHTPHTSSFYQRSRTDFSYSTSLLVRTSAEYFVDLPLSKH